MAGSEKLSSPASSPHGQPGSLSIQYISGIQYMYFMRKFGYKVFTHK